ncbi:unnamed protein product [Caenorhabditis nigoni]
MSRRQARTEDCRYFANGICSKGNACTFRHDEATRRNNICQFHLAGKCSFGEVCRFKHVERSEPSKSSGFNVEAPAFVPSWLKKPISSESSSMSHSSPSSSNDQSTSSSSEAIHDQMCPNHERTGICHSRNRNCAFLHGDFCDLCNHWCLHPFDQDLRQKHHQECTANHLAEMERAFLMKESEEKSCGICMDKILEKKKRFGILNGCQHCFCLDCIRRWRSRDQQALMATEVVRSCPECRQHSDYVIPSIFWVEKKDEKELFINMYKDNMKTKICKYYAKSQRGFCKFGNKCFYKHQLPDGTVDPGKSPQTRRRERLFEFLVPDETDSDDLEDDWDYDEEDVLWPGVVVPNDSPPIEDRDTETPPSAHFFRFLAGMSRLMQGSGSRDDDDEVDDPFIDMF